MKTSKTCNSCATNCSIRGSRLISECVGYTSVNHHVDNIKTVEVPKELGSKFVLYHTASTCGTCLKNDHCTHYLKGYEGCDEKFGATAKIENESICHYCANYYKDYLHKTVTKCCDDCIEHDNFTGAQAFIV